MLEGPYRQRYTNGTRCYNFTESNDRLLSTNQPWHNSWWQIISGRRIEMSRHQVTKETPDRLDFLQKHHKGLKTLKLGFRDTWNKSPPQSHPGWPLPQSRKGGQHSEWTISSRHWNHERRHSMLYVSAKDIHQKAQMLKGQKRVFLSHLKSCCI